MTRPTIDPPGTCHLVMCPGKGQHEPHPSSMSAPTPESYARQNGDPLADLAAVPSSIAHDRDKPRGWPPCNQHVWRAEGSATGTGWDVVRHEQAERGGAKPGTAHVVLADVKPRRLADSMAEALAAASYAGRMEERAWHEQGRP